MMRHVAVVAVALCLMPSWLSAQSVVLTVNTESATVHKAPMNGSPVIGTARRGAVLEVTRELGSWVKISWPAAQDGVGYVHISMGTVAHAPLPNAIPPAGSASVRPGRATAPPTVPPAPASAGVQRTAVAQPPPTRPVYISVATHSLGLGARVGGAGFGASGRAWRRNRVGIGLELSHYSHAAGLAHVTSVQFEPSVLYALKDRVSDYLWLRPYVGSGVNIGRQTLSGTLGNSVSDDRFGFQAFGGGEMTLAGLPRFALSADVGYRWSRAPFAGVDLGGLGVSVSGHWYVR